MLDRRRTPPANETWVMQADLNEILYSSPPTAAAPYRSKPTSGALYQLLGRTPGAQGRALMLRRSMTQLVTEDEWPELLDCMHSGVRSLTLLPRDVAIAAVCVFGPSRASVAVLEALGAAVPPGWDVEEAGEDEEGGGEEEEEEEGGGEEDEQGAGEEEEDDGSDGEEEEAEEEEEECSEEDEDNEEEEGSEDDEEEEGSEEEEEEEAEEGITEADAADDTCAHQSKRARLEYVPEQLERELAAFSRYRLDKLNMHRTSIAARPSTVLPPPCTAHFVTDTFTRSRV